VPLPRLGEPHWRVAGSNGDGPAGQGRAVSPRLWHLWMNRWKVSGAAAPSTARACV